MQMRRLQAKTSQRISMNTCLRCESTCDDEESGLGGLGTIMHNDVSRAEMLLSKRGAGFDARVDVLASELLALATVAESYGDEMAELVYRDAAEGLLVLMDFRHTRARGSVGEGEEA